MGDIRGFINFRRKEQTARPLSERIHDWREVTLLPSEEDTHWQSCRCMDCGIPFCHWGCPIGNYIPEWNDLLFKGQWKKAYDLLCLTNSFAEITGRLCPALCEYACVLDINDEPITIRQNELAIIEYAFKEGYVTASPPPRYSGKRIAVMGSGPAGLSCAEQLNRFGHKVVVFEKDDNFGGILRYGIPDFKLEKWVLDRRLDILRREGIEFVNNTEIGKDIKAKRLLKEFDALVLAGGCRQPRDLKIEGRDLEGIYFALEYLIQANRRNIGKDIKERKTIDARGKKVVVIGGGDTGSDCIGVAVRQGARSIAQIEILPPPPSQRPAGCPWPNYPTLLKNTSSHQEVSVRRLWQILTKRFLGENGRIKKLICTQVDWERDASGCLRIKEREGREFEIEADLVILALGFLCPELKGIDEDLRLKLDECKRIITDSQFMTTHQGVFSCGDMHRGQSLVVWAIYEGRASAFHINRYLLSG